MKKWADSAAGEEKEEKKGLIQRLVSLGVGDRWRRKVEGRHT